MDLNVRSGSGSMLLKKPDPKRWLWTLWDRLIHQAGLVGWMVVQGCGLAKLKRGSYLNLYVITIEIKYFFL